MKTPKSKKPELPDLTYPVARWMASSNELFKSLVDERLVDPDGIRHVIHRLDRVRVHKELSAKGMSTRQIAGFTGWNQRTIARDLGETHVSETETNVSGRHVKRESALRTQLAIAQKQDVLPEGKYGTVVIDPPWPMKKIEREVRPNQVEFDYPTMEYEDIRAYGREKILPRMRDDCHVFMWTTHRFLPVALRLFEDWGVKYVLTMVWHKPGGFQPVGLPQYNCEFVLYGRVGAPEFIDTTQFDCCFDAARQGHSIKPEEFYETVRRVTLDGRVDWFSRQRHEGFDQAGNEADGSMAEAAE
jgi:N6-adenosine-specific RNA methylase IME4